MLPATFHLCRCPWEGRWLCRLWNIEPWGLLRKDHMALPFFSLGFVPCPVQFFPMPWSSFLLPFPFSFHRQSSKSRDVFHSCNVVTKTGNQWLFILKNWFPWHQEWWIWKKQRLFSKQVWGSPFYDWQLLSKFWWFYMNYFTAVIEVVMRNTYVCVVVGEGG